MTTWIKGAEKSDFTIHHLPYGIFSIPMVANDEKRVGVAIGDKIIDLFALAGAGLLEIEGVNAFVFKHEYLNPFMALGKEVQTKVRARLQELLTTSDELKNHSEVGSIIVDAADAQLYLPVKVRDYTDFYSSIEHATNVGKMFRDPENALLPNWKHIPVGYHGRASSIIPSGQNIVRPKGQKAPAEAGGNPTFGPSTRLDIELETAFFTCKENELGQAISINDAKEYIWGFALFNDWSARDIQKWEYVPLGPYLGKSFASSVSCWITPMDALEPFRVAGPEHDKPVLPYLQEDGKNNYDIHLEVWLETASGVKQLISESNYKYMYWSMTQQLTHQTVNGCNVGVGDLYGSGTISGKDKNSYGSLLELSWAGKEPIELSDGTTRTFLEDGDTIILKGSVDNGEIRFGLGEVRTTILPAN